MIIVPEYSNATEISAILAFNFKVRPMLVNHERDTDYDELESLVKESQGMVLVGGSDINPALYGESPTFTRSWDDNRDNFELNLLDMAMRHNKKVLGICRGSQIMNVALGGSLYQDIHEEGYEHAGVHLVDLIGFGAELHGNYKTVHTNSYHHQAVKELGMGMEVVGQHRDGVVEMTYQSSLNWVGVQWHPEWLDFGAIGIWNWLLTDDCEVF